MLPAKNPRTLMWLIKGALAALQLVIVLLLFSLWWNSKDDAQGQAMREAGIVRLAEPRALPEPVMADTSGRAWRATGAPGRWQLVFFGYTYCPDICPTTLAELRQIYQSLPDAAREWVQVVMVTVDPHRDTLEQLRAYLDFFDHDFLGVNGALVDIQTLSQALSIPFIPGDIEQPGYTVDHSGNLAIIGPDGRQWGFVRAPFNVPALIEQLPALLAP